MHRLSYERGGGGVRWPLIAATVVVALAVVAVAAWYLVVGDGTGDGGEEGPEFAFTVRRVRAVGPMEDGADDRLRTAAEDLSDTLDAMYTAGFVDPGRWEDGTFPDVLEAFSSGAARGARNDLADLTLGPEADGVVSVEGADGRLDVRFLLREDGRPFAAVAAAAFEATGVMEGGATVDVSHSGSYLMRPEEGRWVIIGYRVEGRIRPSQPEGTPQ